MLRCFSRLLSRVAVHPLSLAVAALIATTAPGLAGPVALVENVVGYTGPQVMDYLHDGQVVRLGPYDTIVLSYLNSCVRETITGGIVTVGINHSDVQGGNVTRSKADCPDRMSSLTRNSELELAGRVFRGLTPQQSGLSVYK